MADVRQYLGAAVALSRPELTQSEQRRLVDRIIQLIGNPRVEAVGSPVRMNAVGDQRDFVTRLQSADYDSQLPLAHTVGFATTCAGDGIIEEVIRDGIGLGPRFAAGTRLTTLASPFHARKATRFLRDVLERHALFDYPLSVMGPSRAVLLYWSAVSMESRTIVIGTRQPLFASVPEELSQLAERNPSVFVPFLKELAVWRQKTANVPLKPQDDPIQSGASESPSESGAHYHGIPGRRRLLDLAAHDLLNPISGILTACEYLIEDVAGVLEPHQTLFLYSIASSSRVALRLIHEMAQIARPRLDKPTLELQPADIVSVLQREVASVRALAEEMKVTVELKVSKYAAALQGDPLRLAEAFQGLLINAIGSLATPAKIVIDIGTGVDELTVTVQRSMPLAAERGSTAAGARRKNPRKLSDVHAALVLAQARRIINAHGGTLRVESHAKHGASWTVTLPAVTNAPVRNRRTIAG